MSIKDKIERIKEALTLWASLDLKNLDEEYGKESERVPLELGRKRRAYHLKVLNDFEYIIQHLGMTDMSPEWQNYVTSASESKGGEEPKRAEVEGVNAEKGRK